MCLGSKVSNRRQTNVSSLIGHFNFGLFPTKKPPTTKSDKLAYMLQVNKRRRRLKEIRAGCRKFCGFLFSQIGLSLLVVGYTIIGGVLFRSVELENEKAVKNNGRELRNLLADHFSNAIIQELRYQLSTPNSELTTYYKLPVGKSKNKSNVGNSNLSVNNPQILKPLQRSRRACKEKEFAKVRQWLSVIDTTLKRITRQELHRSLRKLVKMMEDEGWNGEDAPDDFKWSWEGSILFAVTVITTIGYGHAVPKTNLGKLFTIIYALIGIPLVFLYLTNIGDYLATLFRILYAKICRRCCEGVCLGVADNFLATSSDKTFEKLGVNIENFYNSNTPQRTNVNILTPIGSPARNTFIRMANSIENVKSTPIDKKKHRQTLPTKLNFKEEVIKNNGFMDFSIKCDNTTTTNMNKDMDKNNGHHVPAVESDIHTNEINIAIYSEEDYLQGTIKNSMKHTYGDVRQFKSVASQTSGLDRERSPRLHSKSFVIYKYHKSYRSIRSCRKGITCYLKVSSDSNIPSIGHLESNKIEKNFGVFKNSEKKFKMDLLQQPSIEFCSTNSNAANSVESFHGNLSPCSINVAPACYSHMIAYSTSARISPSRPKNLRDTDSIKSRTESMFPANIFANGRLIRRLSYYSEESCKLPPSNFSKLSKDFDEKRTREDISDVTVPISLSITIMATYILIGAVVFSIWEDSNYLKWSYFCFVTLSTIGFGDIVPGTKIDSTNPQEKLAIITLYVAIGLSVFAMCFKLMQEEVLSKCKWLGRKIGVLKQRILKQKFDRPAPINKI